MMDGTYHQTPPEPYIPTSKYQRRGMLKIAEPSVVGISEPTISGYLERRRELLGEVDYQLLSCFAYTLKAEGQSPWSIYTALQRVTKFATFLKNYGKCLVNPDPILPPRLLYGIPNPSVSYPASSLKRGTGC